MSLKILFFLLLITVSNAVKRYDNYTVFSVHSTTEEQNRVINVLRENGYLFWDGHSADGKVSIMVSPKQKQNFTEMVTNAAMVPETVISNVQKLIDEQQDSTSTPRTARNSLGSFTWTAYHSYEEINTWLDELQVMYPDVVTTVTMGTSNEGRAIRGVVIDFKKGGRENPLIGFIEGGIHSREWISPATVTWIIKEFLTSEDLAVRSMAEDLVWHIFPVVNPDGYVYTFTTDRLWRKNRNPAYHSTCTFVDDDKSNGIDLNRNFDYLWMSIGASSNPCDETFAGPSALSEPESRAITDYLLEISQQGEMIYYISFHSAAQMLLIPFSHVSGLGKLEVENYADLYEIAARSMEKLAQRNGTQYEAGVSAEVLYEVSGSSFDWVKGESDVPIVYLYELRGRPEGFGFLFPATRIVSNNEEIMDSLTEMDRMTKVLGYYTSTSGVTALTTPFYVLFACIFYYLH